MSHHLDTSLAARNGQLFIDAREDPVDGELVLEGHTRNTGFPYVVPV